MKKKIVTYYCCVIMLFAGVSVFAEKTPPTPPNNKSNLDVPPPGVPIDGGISLLFITGVAYGVYAIKKKIKD
ncbi:MAG: PID-CTERM protein-sorting domain-containing protein [Lutibacter sp.]